jgi:ribose transport system substrate-binding protein
MKKALTLLLVAVLALALVGCSAPQTSTETASQSAEVSTSTEVSNPETSAAADTITVGMSMIDYTNTGFIGIKTGADKAAADYGIELIWKGCEGNLDTQIDVIRGFIQQKVDVVMIDSVDVNGLVSVVNEATDAGIDVLAIGSSIPGTANYNAVYPDYLDAKFAARMIGTMYEGQTGTIGLIVGSSGNLVSDNRQKGFEDGIAEFPNLKLVTGVGQWDATTAMTAAQDIINANPDLLHIHVIQDGMSYGVLRAVQNSGKTITMSSNDGDAEGLDNYEAGYYVLENLNGAERIGYWFVALCYFIANDYDMDITQYDTTYKIMSDELKAKATEGGIDVVDGVQITTVSLEEAREMGQNYLRECSKDTFVPTNSGN